MVPRLLCLALLASGCSIGMGPSTAATRPILGQTMSNDDAKMWVVSSNQSNVPAGLVRVEQVDDGFAKVFNYVSITSAVKKGSATPTVSGVEQTSKDVIELDLALTGRIPLPIGGVSIGIGRVWSIEDKTDLGGLGVRASVAPIGQLSVDFARSWGSGTYEDMSGAGTAISGTRTSLGATLLLWGLNQFRFGVSVAKAWTSTEIYSSTGYTYTLVGTMY
jgi:hypothetical protein